MIVVALAVGITVGVGVWVSWPAAAVTAVFLGGSWTFAGGHNVNPRLLWVGIACAALYAIVAGVLWWWLS